MPLSSINKYKKCRQKGIFFWIFLLVFLVFFIYTGKQDLVFFGVCVCVCSVFLLFNRQQMRSLEYLKPMLCKRKRSA
ncbi:hypothetical protein CLU79DRAFT_775105 [Phycomyces nitens]|nr:hypothetical protein CLU79DRAFT_775105 [Phycomyces nitens]